MRDLRQLLLSVIAVSACSATAAADKLVINNNWNTGELREACSTEDAEKREACGGLFKATAKSAIEAAEKEGACLIDPNTLDHANELYSTTMQYLASHPELSADFWVLGITKALMNSYPCPK